MRINKIMEVENAMIKLAKDKGNYKKGDKVTIVAEHPEFNHLLSNLVE